MAFCGNCGNKIEDNVSFCPECGALIEKTQLKNQKKNATKRRGKKKNLILFIVLACILAGTVVLVKVVKDKRYKNSMDIREASEELVEKSATGKEKPEKQQQEKTDKISESVPKKSNFVFSTGYSIENAKDGYFIVSKFDGALYGLLDSHGNEVIPLEYDEIIFPESKKAQAVIVKAEGKMGLIDYSGKDILPLEYSKISNFGDTSELYLVEKDGVQSIVELDGRIYKKLAGKYGSLFDDCLLSTNEYGQDGELYSLEEQLVFAVNPEILETSRYTGAKGYIEIIRADGDTYSIDLMDAQGNIVLSFEGGGKKNPGYYTPINTLGTGGLFRIRYSPEILGGLSEKYKIINASKKEISEKYYNSIYECGENIFAISKDAEQMITIDVYNAEGQLENTIDLNSKSVETGGGLIAAQYGETYRIYNSTGKEVADERYLSVDYEKDYLVIQNLEGKYGLMAPDGRMRIDFGNMGKESYNSLPWKQTYVFGDTFCIVTEASNANNVWFF